jgi:predicted permease
MWDFVRDVQFGLRMMLKTPLVMAVAAVSLALGISANTTTFSVANGFFFAPFPYENQDELLILWQNHRNETEDQPVSPANYLDFRERVTVFEDLIAYDVIPANMTGGDQPERVQLVETSPETLALLGREPFLGRAFETKEGVPGSRNVSILTYPFWQRTFGEDRDVLGETILLDGEPHTIVGIMPEDFDFIPADVDLFRPTNWEERKEDREERSLLVLGRLQEGRTVDEAQAEISTIGGQLREEYPEANEGYVFRTIVLRDFFPGPTDTILIYILLTVAGFVLLIACANIANLLLARAEARQREIAVRTALGAGRGRILRQLLTESVLLALLGGTLGTIASVYSIRGVATSMPAMLPRAFLPHLDGTVLLYTLGASVLAGMIFGVTPALHSFGDDIRESLGENSRGGTATRKRNRLRSAFVAAELAAALALLVGASVLMDIFDSLIMAGAGFDTKGVLTAQLTISEDRYPEDADVVRFQREVLRRLEETPGVESVATMINLPRSRGVAATDFTVDGRPPPPNNEEPQTDWQSVNPDYFDALGVPILRGRGLTGGDRQDTQPVVVVNESFVAGFFPDQDPIGAQITVFSSSRQIVGVAQNVFQRRMPGDDGGIQPTLYVPFEQRPWRDISIAMRVSGEPSSLADAVRSAIWAIDPDQPITAIQPLDEHIETELAGPQVVSLILGIFGSTALLLSTIGIYGVMAHNVAQRRREIGIRMALGAARKDVVRLVTLQGMRLAAIGLLMGAPMAYAMTRAIQSMIFTVDVVEPAPVAAVTATLAVVAFLATYLPARKAARVHLVRALQTE